MGRETMGRVTVRAIVENMEDALCAERGQLSSDKVRRIVIDDALIDTGATTLSMPRSLVEKLGLRQRRVRRSKTAGGTMFDPVNLVIQGRDCVVDVAGLPEECPVLVGQIPLEARDWVVDPNSQRLIGNPAHGGEWTIEQY
jgi:predicted aspartyl protease